MGQLVGRPLQSSDCSGILNALGSADGRAGVWIAPATKTAVRRKGRRPVTASTIHTGSRCGLEPPFGTVSASLTRTVPLAVAKVVSRTFVPGR